MKSAAANTGSTSVHIGHRGGERPRQVVLLLASLNVIDNVARKLRLILFSCLGRVKAQRAPLRARSPGSPLALWSPRAVANRSGGNGAARALGAGSGPSRSASAARKARSADRIATKFPGSCSTSPAAPLRAAAKHPPQPLVDPCLAAGDASALYPCPYARRLVQRPLDHAGRVVVERHDAVCSATFLESVL